MISKFTISINFTLYKNYKNVINNKDKLQLLSTISLELSLMFLDGGVR